MKNIKLKQLIVPIIFIVLGILFIIFSDSVANYFIIILGSITLIYGLTTLFIALYNKKKYNPKLDYYKGGICSILGLLLILFSKNIANLIMAFSGFAITVSGLLSTYTAWKLYPRGKEKLVRLIFGICELLIGLTIAFAPQTSMQVICLFIGGYLIWKGILMIIDLFFLNKKKNYGFFYTKSDFRREENNDPNIIDHDEIRDDQILKK
ncbi:MAG: DUF308 domain-containing protein [Bacilli bacterium]|nr:DUF308 domain-containing protein [Bacilli bacterium]